MERHMIRQIRTLAHKECCNCIDGKCIYHGSCTVINSRYPSIHDGAIDCDYFLECVLPFAPELNRIVWSELLREEDMIRPDERTCVCCGAAFVPGSSRSNTVRIANLVMNSFAAGTNNAAIISANGRKTHDCYRLEVQKALCFKAFRNCFKRAMMNGSSPAKTAFQPVTKTKKES